MSTELRLRRGNSTATSTFVGAEGEITVNTTNDSIHVHDGVTAGGFQTARADLNNVTNATFAAKALAANVGGNISGNITGASTTATYVTIGSEGGILPNSRRIQSGNGIILSDGGGGGAASIAANLSSSAPSNLGAAAAGVSTQIARADHVHQLPTASQVGAVSQSTYIIAGNGLSGTGNLSSNVTLSLNANLGALGDVTTANVTNGDILVYNSATSKWNNTSNFPRLTTKYNSSNVGTANIVSTLNFIAGSEVTVAANANVTTQTDITIPTIYSSTQIQNLAGNVGATGVNGGITATYDSANKRLNLSANTHTITLSGAVTGNATIANLANATITTTIPANSVLLGTHSAGAYVSNVSPGAGLAATYTGQSTANVGANAVISLDVTSNQFNQGARDAFSTGISNGAQSGLTVVYNRSGNSISFTTNTFSTTLSGAVTGTATSTGLSNLSIATSLAANAVTMGTHTTGAYLGNVTAGSGTTVTWAGGTADEGQNATIGINTSSSTFTIGARDAIGDGFANGTQNGITITYNRSANSYSFGTRTQTVALTGAITGSASSTNLANISINTVIASSSVVLGTHTAGAYLANVAAGTASTITWTGGSGNVGPTATVGVNVSSSDFTIGARDAISDGFTNGTHGGITITYNRSGNAYSFGTRTQTLSLTGAVSGTASISNLANASISTVIANNSVTLGTHTTGAYLANVAGGSTLTTTWAGGSGNVGPTATLDVNVTSANFTVGARDAISTGFNNGTHGGIGILYNKSANSFALSANTFTVTLSGAVTGTASSTNLSNIAITTVNANNGVILGTHTAGAYLANVATGSTLTTTWAGGSGNVGQTATLDVNVTSANFTVGARDAISTGFNNGTQGGIAVVYNKSANSFSLSANTFTVALTGAVTGTATSTNLSNITISTTNAANGVILGTHTSGAYLANVAAGNGAVISWTGGTGNVGQTATVGVNVASDYFTMAARDAIGTGFTNGSQSGVTVVYNRAANAYSISANTFTVTLNGPITGTNTVSSLSNVSITTQIAANSVTLGTHTVGSYVSNVLVSGTGLSATSAGGANAVPTITINSASTNTPSSVVLRDASGNFSANTITGSLTGLASQNLPLTGGTLTGAVTLAADPTNNLHAATKRYVDNAGANVSISMGGDVTASGTASSLITTLANSGVVAGTYTGRITIDQKGRITSAANVTTLSGFGITDGVNTSSSQTINGNKTFSNDVTVSGNLIVQGNSTSLSVTSVSTSDKTITVASGATGASTADQSGIKVAGANANILYDYVSNSWQINKPLTPATTGAQDIGTSSLSWRNAYLSGNLTVGGTINASVTGTVTAAGNVSGGTQYSLPYQTAASTTTFLAPGNTGWVLTTNGLAGAPAWVNPSTLTVGTATSATTAASAGSANTAVYVTGGTQGNITAVGTLTGLSVSGTVQPVSGSNASVSLGGVANYWNSIYAVTHVVGTGGITNAGAAGTGNIGSVGVPFNTVHAVATSAKYADLAEKYVTDQEYDVGTVMVVGGEAEVTASQSGDLAIGVISAEPAYLMNSESSGQAVALKGRVPVKVVGAVKKGQQLVAAEDGTARAVEGSHMNKFAVALESNDAAGVKLVEAIIL